MFRKPWRSCLSETASNGRGKCHLGDEWARKRRLEIDFRFYICEDRGCPKTGQFLPLFGEVISGIRGMSGVKSCSFQRQCRQTLPLGSLPAPAMFSSQGLNLKWGWDTYTNQSWVPHVKD